MPFRSAGVVQPDTPSVRLGMERCRTPACAVDAGREAEIEAYYGDDTFNRIADKQDLRRTDGDHANEEVPFQERQVDPGTNTYQPTDPSFPAVQPQQTSNQGIATTNPIFGSTTTTPPSPSATSATPLLAGSVAAPYSVANEVTATTTSMNLPTTTAQASTSSENDGLSQSAKIGIGVGIGVGIPFIVAIIALLISRHRRRRHRMEGAGRGYAPQENSAVSMVEPLTPPNEDVVQQPPHQPEMGYYEDSNNAEPATFHIYSSSQDYDAFHTPISAVTPLSPTSHLRELPELVIPEQSHEHREKTLPRDSTESVQAGEVSPVSPLSPVSALSNASRPSHHHS